MSDISPQCMEFASAAADMAALQELEFVQAASLNGIELIFELTSCPGETFCVVLPENYPNGEPNLLPGRHPLPGQLLRPGRLAEIVKLVFEKERARDSASSVFSDSDGLSQDEVDDDDDDGSVQEPGSRILLDDDIGRLTSYLSSQCKGSVEEEKHVEIDESLVVISLPLSELLDPLVADAWGIDRNVPLVVRLLINRSLYPGPNAFVQVECCQKTRKHPLNGQLQSILEEFLGLRKLCCSSSTEAELGQENDGVAHDEPSPYEHRMQDVGKLVRMGFDPGFVVIAVKLSNDLAEAVGLLLDGLHLCAEVVEAAAAEAAGAAERSSIQNPTLLLKRIPPIRPEHGFLVQLVEYLWQRIPTCASFCVICDQPHVVGTGALIKPTVCNRALCVFQFQDKKFGFDSVSGILEDNSVVPFLVTVAKAAAESSRAQLIFEPYPSIMDPQNNQRFLYSPDARNLNEVRKVFSAFPSFTKQEYMDHGEQQSIESLQGKHPHAWLMLQWVISSNRSHIVRLSEEYHLPSMHTPHQFLLVTAAPEKQHEFSDLKAQCGGRTMFAWHGSPVDNWHSILRRGLTKDTKYMLHGNAYGPGVYVSPSLRMSLGYSENFRRSATGSFCCVALCEIIPGRLKQHDDIWVVPQDSHVLTRFLFAYERGKSPSEGVDQRTTDPAFLEEIHRAMGAYGLL